MNQVDLYRQWKTECEKLSHCRDYIENDFDKMLYCDMCTKQEIENSIHEFKDMVQNNINNLKDLELKICEFLWEKSR